MGYSARDRTGMVFGERTVQRRQGKAKDGSALWAWKCSCGNTGTCTVTQLKRAGRCRKCAPKGERTEDADYDDIRIRIDAAQHGHRKFPVMNGARLLEVKGRMSAFRKEYSYVCECMRCGAVTVRTRKSIRQSQGCCGKCRLKKEVFGALISLDDACELFEVKKTLVHHRIRRKGMSLEDALTTPVRKQRSRK